METEKDFQLAQDEKECNNLKAENIKLVQDEQKCINFEAEKDFQLTLFKEVIKKNLKKNVVISQASLLFPLAIISKGAKDKTLSELLNVLNDSTNQNLYVNKLQDIYESLKDESNVILANSIISKNKIKDNFIKEGEKLDIQFDDNLNINKINDWVNEKTKGKITNIIDDLNHHCLMVILNAIYFEAEWMKRYTFAKCDTKPNPFYLSDNTIKDVLLMYQENSFDYVENEYCQSVKLYYNKCKIIATIILPAKNVNINDFILNMNSSKFNEFFDNNNYHLRKVELYLPKIKLENSYILNNILYEMGLSEPFTKNANFSLISSIKPLYLDEVFQKSYLEINETGTIATAATAILLEGYCPASPVIMKCDRPYFLFISKFCSKIKQHIILFSCKIENPNNKF